MDRHENQCIIVVMYTLHVNDEIELDVHVEKFDTYQEAKAEGERWKREYKDISYWIDKPAPKVNYSYGTDKK